MPYNIRRYIFLFTNVSQEAAMKQKSRFSSRTMIFAGSNAFAGDNGLTGSKTF